MILSEKTYDLAIVGGTIISPGEKTTEISNSLILIKNGVIEYAGTKKVIGEYRAKKILSACNKYVIPAFFNQHTHLSLALFRGLGTDMSLHNWLQKAIWPLEKAYSNPENVYLGSLLSLIEMIKSGTGTLADMDFHSKAVGKAVEEAGIRAFLGEGLFDGETPSHSSPEENFAYTEELLDIYSAHPLIKVYITPHASFSCSPGLYKKAGELGRKWGIPVCSHLSETKEEVRISMERYGVSPVKMLEDTGVFDGHFIAVHGVHLNENDREVLKKHDIPVIHNPHSNMVLGSGLCPVKDLINRGVRVGIGTDSAASNNNLSLLKELQTAYLIHKGFNHDASLLPSEEVFKMGNLRGYDIYRMEDFGEIKEGFKADIQIIDLNGSHNLPVMDPVGSILSSAHSSDVKTLIVNGRIIMEDREIKTIDEGVILQEARKFGEKLKKEFPSVLKAAGKE